MTDPINFNGSNWHDLTRLVIATKLEFIQDAALDDDSQRYATQQSKCAKLASSFTGPALDWVGHTYETNNALFTDYNNFILTIRNAFGISDDGLQAQRRGELDVLSWNIDLPVFFAEFDRLTTQLQLNGHETRIALLKTKLPLHMQNKLAEQALNFNNYETMRERLLAMWSLDPGRTKPITQATATEKRKRPRCGRCGRRGHSAADCKAKK